MLIRFNVKNFLSFSDKNGKSQEFSMIAGKTRKKAEHVYADDDIKLLKLAAIYGANASGKSNLIHAMKFMQASILLGMQPGCTDMYCKTKSENKQTCSYFETEILLNGQYYSYGFEIMLSQSKFISEWLVKLNPNDTEEIIFQRDIANGAYAFHSTFQQKDLLQRLTVYADDIKTDGSVLFLTIMNQNKGNIYEEFESFKIVNDIYLWFKNSLDISYPNQSISDYLYMTVDNNFEEVCRLISAFGTGISSFEMVNMSLEAALSNVPAPIVQQLQAKIDKELSESIPTSEDEKSLMCIRGERDFILVSMDATKEIRCQTLQFYHNNKDVLFTLNEESDGTVRLLDLLEILVAGENKTYIIDELDRCLHPSMTYKFIETFLTIAKSKNIQVIVTTHESRLLDFDLLRRDEIWFIHKSIEGTSDIYSLEEYNERFDKKIDKAYLEGRYGGIPIFNTIFPITGA